MVEIFVCIKQVPNTDNVKFDWKKGALIREGIENIMNPDDYHALEMALQLKEKYGGSITAITLGPPQAEEILRGAYAMGVDKCVLITDKRFAGSDSLVTSKILSRAIQKLGEFDFIITGFQTIDGATGQVSYQLSEIFKIPHLTQVNNIQLEGKCIIVNRLFGHEYQKVKLSLPVLIAAKRESNKVRYPKLIDIKTSIEKKIIILTMDDIGGRPEEYGFAGSPTITLEGEIIQHKRKQQKFEGSIDEKVEQVVMKLKKYGFLKN